MQSKRQPSAKLRRTRTSPFIFLRYEKKPLFWEISLQANIATASHVYSETTKKVSQITDEVDIAKLNFSEGIQCASETGFVINDYDAFCKRNPQIKLYSSGEYYQSESTSPTSTKAPLFREESQVQVLHKFWERQKNSGISAAFSASSPTVPTKKSRRKSKGKEKTPVRKKRSSTTIESPSAAILFLDIEELLANPSVKGETLAYRDMRQNVEEQLATQLNSVFIATDDLIHRWEKEKNNNKYCAFLNKRLTILKAIVDFLNIELQSKLQQFNDKELTNFKAYLTHQLYRCCKLRLLPPALDHEITVPNGKKLSENYQTQMEASHQLEDTWVAMMKAPFTIKNLSSWIGDCLSSTTQKNYPFLLEALSENLRDTGQYIRHHHQSGRKTTTIAKQYHFIPLKVAIKEILTNLFNTESYEEQLYEEQKNVLTEKLYDMIIGGLLTLHDDLKSGFKFVKAIETEKVKRKQGQIYIKTNHDIKRVVYSLLGPKEKSFDEILKKMAKIKEKTICDLLQSWLDGVPPLQKIDPYAVEIDETNYVGVGEEPLPEPADEGEPSKEEKETKAIPLWRASSRAVLSIFGTSPNRESQSMPTSPKNTVINDTPMKPRKFEIQRRSQSVDSGLKLGIGLDFNHLLQQLSQPGFTRQMYLHEVNDCTEKLGKQKQAMLTAPKQLIYLIRLENRIQVAKCMDERMDCLKKLVAFLNDMILVMAMASKGQLFDAIQSNAKDHLSKAITQALDNTYLSLDLIHEGPEVLSDIEASELLKASINLEDARISMLVHFFKVPNLPEELGTHILSAEVSENYDPLLKKLSSNVKETGRCLRENRRRVNEEAEKVSARKIENQFFGFVPLEYLIHRLIPYNCKLPKEQRTVRWILKSALSQSFLQAHGKLFTIPQETAFAARELLYIKLTFANLLEEKLKVALKIESLAVLLEEAIREKKARKEEEGDSNDFLSASKKSNHYASALAEKLNHLKGKKLDALIHDVLNLTKQDDEALTSSSEEETKALPIPRPTPRGASKRY